MSKPNLPAGLGDWDMIWNDEFNSFNQDKWRIEKIMPDFQGNRGQMSQHQTNTFGFDNDGNLKNGASPDGKRHAMWYDKHLDKTLKVRDGALIMGAYKSDERDPSIKDSHHPYKHPQNGKTADFRNKIYTSWVDTYAMSWHDGALRPARQESPNFYFRYGVAEFCVNFENSNTSGLRQSGWLLPAVDPADEDKSLVGTTYDSNAANGVECDVWEWEGDGNTPGDRKNFLLCKNIGANAVKIPAVDCRKFGIKIYEGDHTISVRWTDKGTWWYVDGVEVAADTQCVVHIAMALYLTREGNSAVGGGDGAPADPPYRQRDYGLWGRNVGTETKAAIDADEVAVKYVRVYQDKNQNGNWIAPNWRNKEGVESANTVATVAPVGDRVVAAPKTVSTTGAFNIDSVEGFNVYLDGNKLSWDSVNSDDYYDIKFNNNVYKATVKGSTEFTIPDNYQDGQYFVTSTPKGGPFVNSQAITYPAQAASAKPVEVAVPEVLPVEIQPIIKQAEDSVSKDEVRKELSGLQTIVASLMNTINELEDRLD